MPATKIRHATESDAGDLATVYRSAYQENRELGFPAKAESISERDVADWIHGCHVYVATVQEEVVGGVRLEETEPNRVKLSRLGVCERWKGKGIGSRLVACGEEAMREREYDTIWLTTPQEHPFLPEFYQRRGYQEKELYPLTYRDYDEIILEKQL